MTNIKNNLLRSLLYIVLVSVPITSFSGILKKMDVTYGGDQFQTFKSDGDDYNGAPVKTTISLTFGEITLIDKNMVSPQVGGY